MQGFRLLSPPVLWKRVPLAGKALLVTLLAGLAVWVVADQRASYSLDNMVRHDQEAQLQVRLRTDQIRFDRRLRAFCQAATVFAERSALQSLVGGWQGRGPGLPGPVLYHGVPPPWLPPRAVLSALVGPVYALLLTPDGRTWEAYQDRAQDLPPALLHSSGGLLRRASRDDGAIAVLDGTPFLVAARPVTDPSGRVRATLVLALPLGTVLSRVVREDSPERDLLAFLSLDGTQVLASSRPAVLAPGTARSALRGRFLVAGAVSGAGAGTDPAARLIRVARTGVPDVLIGRILAQARDQRLLMALVFVLVFGLLLLWITYRIRALHLRIGEFSRRVGLRRADEDGAGGDEFRLLEHGFQQLMEHVLDETSNLEYQAQHDALTRLPNRVLLYDRLEQAVLGSARDHRCFSLMMMDLDRFKEINDTLGHHIGDLMLKQVGERLLGVLRNTDTVARLGGDEFAVLLPAAGLESAVALARKIFESIERPFEVEGHGLSVGISIGIVHFPTHGADANTLLQRADVAMYQAKRFGSGYAIYDPGQDEHSVERIALMSDLRRAIEEQSLELYFQPEYDMNTGRVCRAEALLRWLHPKFGPIPPEEFIHIAEHTGLIRPLTVWVLNSALRQCARWVHGGLDMEVSVNLSVRNLQDPGLPGMVEELLRRWQVAPRRLMVEVTESAIMSDPSSVRENLHQLNGMGVRTCIDDFGTGYSSLVYLKQLPLQEIKIDRAFVMDMVRDDNDAVIVRAMIDLAHNLGLGVVAEGVETREVWELLEILGCDLAQGNYLGIPLPTEDFINWLRVARLNPLGSNLIRARTTRS